MNVLLVIPELFSPVNINKHILIIGKYLCWCLFFSVMSVYINIFRMYMAYEFDFDITENRFDITSVINIVTIYYCDIVSK